MPVPTSLQYPVPLKKNGLVEDYKQFSPNHKIPQQTINSEVKSLLNTIKETPGFNPNVKFDPKKHIIFSPDSYTTTKRYRLDELKINKTHTKPINNFGAVFPFKIINKEAVNMLLWEAFQPEVLEAHGRVPNAKYGTTRLDLHVGDHFKEAPFTTAFAKSKEITEIVSTFVGYPLQPVWDMDFVHINVSLASNDPIEQRENYPQTQEEIDALLSKQDSSNGEKIPTTTGVHYDSITVPLVIMLDLPEDAQGGQTTIITGDELATRIPDPPIGSGTLIQGRVLRHLATKPVTNHNRISMILSFATGVPGELDNCVLTSIKSSVLPRNMFDKFYRDWASYKFHKLAKHLALIREQIDINYQQKKGFDQESFVENCLKIETYIKGIYEEMECVSNSPYPPRLFSIPYQEL